MKGTGPDRDRTLMTPGPWEAVWYPGDNLWRLIHRHKPDNSIIIGFIADEGDAKLICEAINVRSV